MFLCWFLLLLNKYVVYRYIGSKYSYINMSMYSMFFVFVLLMFMCEYFKVYNLGIFI